MERIKINYLRKFLFFLVLLLVFDSVWSQSNDLTLNFQSFSVDMPYLKSSNIQSGNYYLLNIQNGVNRSNRVYKLKLSIEGNGISMNVLPEYTKDIRVEIGSNILYNSDLASYFDIENFEISGYTKELFYQNGGLPEGVYDVCFELWDLTYDSYHSISNKACVKQWVRKHEVPKITSPKDKGVLSLKNGGVFSWMPRHTAIYPIKYELSIFDYVKDINIIDLINNFTPIIQVKKDGMQYTYNERDGVLREGRQYVAIVKAFSENNNIRFKNSGYSESVVFRVSKNIFRDGGENEESDTCRYPSSTVYINEISNGTGEKEFIELVVVGAEEDGEYVDLTNWIIDDNNFSGYNIGTESGHIRLGSCFSAVPKGTIILLYMNNNGGNIPDGIDPANDYPNSPPGVYQFGFNHECIKKYSGCPYLYGGDDSYNCIESEDDFNYHYWSDYIPMRNPNDVLQIRRPDGQLEHAIIWGTEEYEYVSSPKVVNMGAVNASEKCFSFVTGDSWFDDDNYAISSYANATPGEGNNQDNIALINDLTAGSGTRDFYISCSRNGLDVIIEITGGSGSYVYKVDNGEEQTVTENPIIISGLSSGTTHFFEVVDDSTLCVDYCDIEIETGCVVGSPCDDYNSCTINDILNEYCICVGEPADSVEIIYEKYCDYCADVNVGASYIVSFVLESPEGENIVLDESSNSQGFDFPYCGWLANDPSTCGGQSTNFDFVNDVNSWIIQQGYIGTFSTSKNFCMYQSNLIPITMYGENKEGDTVGVSFSQSFNCTESSNTLTYKSSCDSVISVLWSTGDTTYSIEVDNMTECIGIEVTCFSGCVLESEFCDCVSGIPCNDGDSCTINDKLNSNCDCIGEPVVDVTITDEMQYDSLCDYYIVVVPAQLGLENTDCITTTMMILKTPDGELLMIDEYDNDQGFHFPYCQPGLIGSGVEDCCGSLPQTNYDLPQDLTAWINSNGYKGNSYSGESVGGGNIYIENTNLEIIRLVGKSSGGQNINMEATRIGCEQTTDSLGIILSVESYCDSIGSYLWSTGETTSTIVIDSLGGCYQVTITCYPDTIDCELVGTYGENCDSCIVGTPCNDGDTCTINDVITPNCECVGITSTDSDGDGVCDEIDKCPGFDDNIDFDGDGIPDGCDTIVGCDSLSVLVESDTLYPGDCDYIVNFDSLLGDVDWVSVFQITAGFENESMVIDSVIYNFPICYGNSNGEEDIEEVSLDDFEMGWGFWNGFPPDADRINDSIYSSSGLYSLRIRDNEEFSKINSQLFSVAGYSKTKIDFNYTTEGLNESTDYFALEVSFDNGGSYSVVNTWHYDVDFNNDIQNIASLTINNSSDICKFRILSKTSDDSESIYIDDIHITKLGVDCQIVPSIQKIADGINQWLTDNGFEGHASYDFPLPDTICKTSGHSLLIENTNVEFFSILASNQNTTSQRVFCDFNCEGMMTGDTLLKYKVIPNCYDPTFEWSNGETADSIVIPYNSGAAYTVTVTCDNACDTIITVKDRECVIWDPCVPADTCYSEGYYDDECNCIGRNFKLKDSDNDGIPDCQDECPNCAENDSNSNGICDCDEECPPIDFEFIYTPVLGELCYHCIDVDGLVDSVDYLNNASVMLSNGNIKELLDFPEFNFPYCYEFEEISCYTDSLVPSMKKFRFDLYYWIINQGYDDAYVRYETECSANGNKSLYVANTDFIAIKLSFTTTDRQGNKYGCYSDTTSYIVTVDSEEGCESPQYLWSNGSTENSITIPDTTTGFYVEVTCLNKCVYYDSTDTDCFWGAPCDDLDFCTINDTFDINCNCVGEQVGDEDNDSVCDSLDICPGFDDRLDDDGDGIPNGCDTCVVDTIILCNYCVDLHPDGAGIEPCNYVYLMGYIDTIGSPQYETLGYWVETLDGGCNSNIGRDVYALIRRIQNWIDTSGYVGSVYLDTLTSHCSKNGLSMIIENTTADILGFYNKGYGVLPMTKECKEIITGPGAPCNDGDTCTVDDRLDAGCNCVGKYIDSDFDGVCDSLDKCPGFPDYMDVNDNGVPDGCEDVLFPCGDDSLSFCEYFNNSVDCSDRYQPVPIIKLQEELLNSLENSNENAIVGFNVPELLEQLKNVEDNDYDKDGIVDILDICDSTANSPTFTKDGIGVYTLNDFAGCCENKITGKKASLIAYFLFQPGTRSMYDSSGAVFYTPGCLGNNQYGDDLIELDGFIVHSDSTECIYTFKIDCSGNNCNCEAKLITDADHDGTCNANDTIIGNPCDEKCPDDLDICVTCRIEANPDYDAYTNPGASPCTMVLDTLPDSDGDGICDIVDECEGEDDTKDKDNDGIPDCKDPCVGEGWMGVDNPDIPTPAGPGDPCDDGDPCTYADSINNECTCEGIILDLDDDGVYDCQECDIIFTDTTTGESSTVGRTGPFINCDSCYSIDCDVCPDLPDTLDYNGNGVPDCLDPPYYEIGCPDDYEIIEGVGLVLKFGSDDIRIEDLPQPITLTVVNQTSPTYSISKHDYLTISYTREVAGNYEVLYEVPDMLNLSDDNPSYLSISFAGHQNCVFSDNDTLNDLICPSEFKMEPNGDFKLVLDYSGMDGVADLATFDGAFSINMSSSTDTIDGVFYGGNINNPSGADGYFELTIGSLADIDDFANYSGTITLPNGTVCEYNTGTLETPCELDGAPAAPGSPCPCDPATMDCDCNHHFKLDADCNCVGVPKPDIDGDGLCDEIDPCPEKFNEDTDGDGIGDIDQCPCPPLNITADSLANGSDFTVDMDTTGMGGMTEFRFEITGGPDGIIYDTSDLEMPLIAENLPKGYSYEIKIIGVGEDGCQSDTTVTIDVPFETNPTFCGISLEPVDISSYTLLPVLNKSDKFTASDFEITVRKASGSKGKFTGKGYIKIPFFGNPRINVTFNDITISASRQMLLGSINVNGFGMAIFGDGLSDDINDIINEIINELEDLTDILDEVNEVLERIDELVGSAGDLVSDGAKECVENATIRVEYLDSIAKLDPHPDDIVAQIKGAMDTLKMCNEAFDKEAAVGLDKLIELIDTSIINAKAKCENNEFPIDLSSVSDEFNQTYTNVVNNIFKNIYDDSSTGEGPPGNPTYTSDTIRSSKSIVTFFNPSEFDNSDEVLSYIEIERNFTLCHFMSLFDDGGIQGSEMKSDGLKILDAILRAGVDISVELKDEINSDKTIEEIYNENESYLMKALGNAFSLVYYK